MTLIFNQSECIDIINNEIKPSHFMKIEDSNKYLLGEEIGMEPWELLLLLYSIEGKCRITICENDINEVGLRRVNDIVFLVNKAIQNNEKNENSDFR